MRTWMLLAAIAACGDGRSSAVPDAEPDAPYDAGPTGPISVYAAYPQSVDNATPIATPGAVVLFCDAAGHVVDREITGGDGVAEGMAPMDATVTVLPPSGEDAPVYTWVGAAPGDFLYMDEVYTYTPPVGQERSVLLPRDTGDDVSGYEISMPMFLASNQTPGTSDPVVATGWLAPDSLAAPLAIADAMHANNHHRFFVAHDVTVGPVPLDLTTATWTDPTVVDLSLVNVPADKVWLAGDYELLSDNQGLWYSDDILADGPGDVTLHLDTPGAVGDGTALQLYFQRGHNADATFWALAYNGVPATIDLTALAPPMATEVAVQPDGRASWNIAGDPARALAAELTVYSQAGAWHVLLPPDRRSFELPHVPADLPSFGQATSARVSFLGGNDPGGYAATRGDPTAFHPDRFGKILPKTPGVYRYSGD
jgi:hypothetical protein